MPDEMELLREAIVQAVDERGVRMMSAMGIQRGSDALGSDKSSRIDHRNVILGVQFAVGYDGSINVLPFTADLSICGGPDLCGA